MTDDSWPWPAGAATGIGSLPGTDVAEAQRIVLGELPDFPHLPELPARGPGAELVGRGAGLLVDLPVELYAGRWRVAAHPGRDLRRTRDLLERDLDQLAEQASGYAGPVKVQAAGPWTLAAGLDLAVGGRMLRDPGAVRDLTASLTEGLRAHLAQVVGRLPRAAVVLQLDEPSLPAVLAGHVPTESGFGAYRAVETTDAAAALRSVVEAVDVPVIVHCCAPDVPLDVIVASGAVGVALDLDLVRKLDPLGEALDGGLGLLVGAAPTSMVASSAGAAPGPSGEGAGASTASAGVGSARAAGGPSGVDGPVSPAAVADRVGRLWHRLGFPAEQLHRQVVVTPGCGLAGTTPEYAIAVLRGCREAGRRLAEG